MIWDYCRVSSLTQDDYDRLLEGLSASRRARICRLRKEEDRRRSLAGEGLAKALLQQHFGMEHIALESAPNGRPFVPGDEVFLSIGHCEDLVVCAVSQTPVGIDIERIRPFDLRAAELICVPQELEYVQNGKALNKDDPTQLQRFFEIWTAKEAWFKQQGTGITDFHKVNTLTLQRQQFRMQDYLVQIVA